MANLTVEGDDRESDGATADLDEILTL